MGESENDIIDDRPLWLFKLGIIANKLNKDHFYIDRMENSLVALHKMAVIGYENNTELRP